MISHVERERYLKGVAVARLAPRVSHLLFANDTLIFCQATKEVLEFVHVLLGNFEKASGLKINYKKSAIVISRNVAPNQRKELAAILKVQQVNKHSKYLGLSSSVGHSKKEIVMDIKEQIWRKLNCWATKKLSQVGRAVLIKSAIQAIPTYVMGCF
ncbi:UNVERIFIED_CONTAM: hypothetical protein Slati_1159900 [Sesamum latifolium]|uniref:Reverse transcriptase n=1 Tax=Sesamum latifolium TaxID=2727402 RepID=A0AAW2XDP5_9LAMI